MRLKPIHGEKNYEEAFKTNAPIIVDEACAAAYLSISQEVLRYWRKQRKEGLEAPVVPFVKMGRAIRYRVVDLGQFVLDNLVRD